MSSDRCSECGGAVEWTVLSGVVSLKRKRSMMASGKVSAINARTCIECGRTALYAADPKRLFGDLRKAAGKGAKA